MKDKFISVHDLIYAITFSSKTEYVCTKSLWGDDTYNETEINYVDSHTLIEQLKAMLKNV